MTDKQKAISITQSFIQAHEAYKNHRIDRAGIQERESLWYVPFKAENPDPKERLVGEYEGLIVAKDSNDYLQPGSAFGLEEWMYGFAIGLREGRHDLLIEKVHDYRGTLDMLDKLNLSYVKKEMEGGTEWKIPKNFSRKELKKRLAKIPCTFKNQTFTLAIPEFRQIRNQRIFEYQLLKSENTDPSLLGELIED